MTDTIGAPAAAANVSESWKLMPHSAWPAAMSASGVVVAVRQDLEVDAGVVVPALRLARRRTRCGSCSASSRARAGRCPSGRRPTRDGAARRATARSGDAERRRRRPAARGLRRASPHAAAHEVATSTTREAARAAVHGVSAVDWTSRSPSNRTRKRRPRVPGTASTSRSGLLPSPVRAGSGSAGLWRLPHSQRTRRSPEAVFGCRPMVHRPVGPPASRAARPMTTPVGKVTLDVSKCVHMRPRRYPMRRLSIVLAAAALALGLAAPAVLAAEPRFDHTGQVLIAFNGDVTVPAGEVADAVLVTGGTATIAGQVESVVVLDGDVVLQGATVKTVVATGGTVAIDATSTVTGDVRTLEFDGHRRPLRHRRRGCLEPQRRSCRGHRGPRAGHRAVHARPRARDDRRRPRAGRSRRPAGPRRRGAHHPRTRRDTRVRPGRASSSSRSWLSSP